MCSNTAASKCRMQSAECGMKQQPPCIVNSALYILHSTLGWRSRWDLHPHSSRRQRVAFLFSYESPQNEQCRMQSAECWLSAACEVEIHFALSTLHSAFEMVGSAGNAPARHFQLRLATPDLQSGSRITSRNW